MWRLKLFLHCVALFKTGGAAIYGDRTPFHLMILRCPSIYRIPHRR